MDSISTKKISLSTKKPEDNSKQLENIRKLGSNKQCFDCGEKGTTYVVMSFGTFVCSRCAGLLRDLTFKVKGIGVCNFNETELAFLIKMGNDNAKSIWLAKFDFKREKLPEAKDSEAVRKHIALKYKDKRFAVKDPEKQMTAEKKIEKKAKEESEEESGSGSDSSPSPSPKKKASAKTIKVVKEEKPVPMQKLNPINLKNSLSNNQTNQNSKIIPPVANNKNIENGWANFSNVNPVSNQNNNNNQGGFTFFESNNNTVNNIGATNSGGEKSNIDNMFTFTDAPSNNTNNLNKNSSNEWGIVWDNNASPIKNDFSQNNQNTNTSNKINVNNTNPNLEQSRGSKGLIDNTIDFNFINTPVTQVTNNSIQPPQQVNKINIQNLNQNLNSLYTDTKSPPKTTQKKSLDDLDKYLGDSTLINPIGGGNNSNNYNSNMNQMNMGGQNNNNNSMFMNPQMMQQMQMMMTNPQMMQQMMMTNPQMQGNPQMMQMMQLMMQNMMNNAGNNNIGSNSSNKGMNMGNYNTMMSNNQMGDFQMNMGSNMRNDLGDLNFGMSNLNTGNNTPRTLIPSPVKEEESKYDVFKDIYNYSKTTGGRPSNAVLNTNNMNIMNTSTSNTNYQMTNPIGERNTVPSTNTASGTSGYNPFDLY